jgi:hypothetical protein
MFYFNRKKMGINSLYKALTNALLRGIRPCVWRVVEKMVIACAWHRLIRRLGSLLFVLAKSNQKPLSSKGSLSSILDCGPF